MPVLVYQYIEGCLCVEDGYTYFAGLSNSSTFMPCGTTYYPNNNLDLDGTDSTRAESYMLVISYPHLVGCREPSSGFQWGIRSMAPVFSPQPVPCTTAVSGMP